jgi:hypothetical protein
MVCLKCRVFHLHVNYIYYFPPRSPLSPRNTVPLRQRFPNWWVASRFVVGREKFLKSDFYYVKVKNKKLESKKTLEKGKNKAHDDWDIDKGRRRTRRSVRRHILKTEF